jgi:hypothetical protein
MVKARVDAAGAAGAADGEKVQMSSQSRLRSPLSMSLNPLQLYLPQAILPSSE